MGKNAGTSQVAWALLTEGVTAARLEAHRLRHLVNRALLLAEKSEAREAIYEVAGDIIQAIPTRLDALELELDRTTYALSGMGVEHLRDRLPLSDRKRVDETLAKVDPRPATSATARVADRFLGRRADLDPPLGYPGGPCQVVDRTREEVQNVRVREQLIDEIEFGDDWSNPEAAAVYDLEVERAPDGTAWQRLLIGPHAQYRMDLRGVTVPEVRLALSSFWRAYQKAKSQKSFLAKRWEEEFARSESITWEDPKIGLTLAFAVQGKDVKVVTTYWSNVATPRPPGDGGCDV